VCPSTRRTHSAERKVSLSFSSLIFPASALKVCAAWENASLKVEQVREAKEAIPEAATSLNGPLGSGEEASELGEFIEDEGASDTTGEVIREIEMASFQEALERLPE
jgi:DNA-directed RNA polymerase sigma subunit (sigma70/sigma32)